MPIPEALHKVCEKIHHPALTEVGETITDDGRWALSATVRKGTPSSALEEIRKQAGGFPVIFEEEPNSLPVARPAYPSEGE
jgi:hypothetical protein